MVLKEENERKAKDKEGKEWPEQAYMGRSALSSHFNHTEINP